MNISYVLSLGIHGNDNSNIKIAAVNFRDFEVAAVALNNVDNLVSMILYLILPCVLVPCTDTDTSYDLHYCSSGNHREQHLGKSAGRTSCWYV